MKTIVEILNKYIKHKETDTCSCNAIDEAWIDDVAKEISESKDLISRKAVLDMLKKLEKYNETNRMLTPNRIILEIKLQLYFMPSAEEIKS